MKSDNIKWVYLIVLSIVWGSSFILMKKALLGFSPIEVGALRMVITALVLLPFGFKETMRLSANNWKHILVSAVLGTFFPAFLFAMAIKHLGSSIPAILNSFTPFNALLIGALFFGFSFKKRQIIGILVGLVGTFLLILNGNSVNLESDYYYSSFIIIASIGYAFNVNIIKKYLQDVKPLAITTGSFMIVLIPAMIVLLRAGFFRNLQFTNLELSSLTYITILAVIGTAIAKVFFNKLVQISSPIFSTSVTYLIPIIAVFFALFDGELLNFRQILSGFLILFGVFLVNRRRK